MNRYPGAHVPAVDHAVAVPQPSEAGHLVARRSTVKVYDDVVVGDQQFQAADDVADNTRSLRSYSS